MHSQDARSSPMKFAGALATIPRPTPKRGSSLEPEHTYKLQRSPPYDFSNLNPKHLQRAASFSDTFTGVKFTAHRPKVANDPVLIEMMNGLLFDSGSILEQFTDLIREIREFADDCAEGVGASSKGLPVAGAPASITEKPSFSLHASEFSSVEDYAYFTLLSTINTHLYERIFQPFHPAISKAESYSYSDEYSRKVNTDLQIYAASWRSSTFRYVDGNVTAERKAALLREVARSIADEWLRALRSLPGDPILPRPFADRISVILDTAYKWNSVVKGEVSKYDFEPFVVEPEATWDATRMESFERLRHPVQPGSAIVSPVSLGLMGCMALGGKRVSHVQRKAQVLVEEWFDQSPIGSQPNGTSTAKPRVDFRPRMSMKGLWTSSKSDAEFLPQPPKRSATGLTTSSKVATQAWSSFTSFLRRMRLRPRFCL